jgi:phosphoribosyl 1,2-cyclic phosphodiesterase
LKLSVLASGSSGNCYILSTDTGKLILDCGLPWSQIQRGLNFDLSSVVGALVTHEHKDHCRAVKEATLAGIDCFMSMGTLQHMDSIKNYRLKPVISGMQFDVNDFNIMPFDTQHDSAQPLGFLIQYRQTGEKLLYLTDSYYCRYRFNAMNYIMIECNYIKETLDANIEAGLIDPAMKPRLLQSHFSLENVKGFLKANDLSKCSKIILIHLSAANSHAERMVREIRELTGIDTVVADPGLELKLEQYPY